MKFGRQYKLLVEIKEKGKLTEFIEIANPLTIEFQIERSTGASLNNAILRVYNLKESSRSVIFQNRFDMKNRTIDKRRIVLQAGYGELSTIFIGDLMEAYSYRQGSDIITYMQALDSAALTYNSYINKTFDKGITRKDLFDELANFIGLKKGAVGETEGEYKRAVPINGNTFNLLDKNFKDEYFIDLETINKLKPNEAIKGQLFNINSETGLLGTPLLQGTFINVDLIFEPRIRVGQVVQIESAFNPKFDGQYKVIGVKHSGTISEATSGEAKTNLQLLTGDKLTKGLKFVS